MSRAPAMPNGRCRMHGGLSPGAPKGNKNALKHDLYTAEAIARRREWLDFGQSPCASTEIAPERTGHGLPLSKCEGYNRVYNEF
jgi:hypothetical protein